MMEDATPHRGKGKPMKQAVKPKAGSFQAMGLSHELFRGIMAMGYKVPTPVQRKSLPVTLAGADVVVMARTGSGKTAAFLVPVIEKLGDHSAKIGVRSIILSPTRELAIQTLTFARKMSKFKKLRIALLVGGDSMDKQFTALADNPDIIIATPGRLMHHLQEVPEFTLRSVEIIVFDEADRLFEMGFAEQLREIMRSVPEERQSLLFSATMPKQLVQFARAGLKDPALIRLDTESKISTELSLAFFTCRSADKAAALMFLLREVIPPNDMTIIFVATRHHAEFLHEVLKETGTQSSVVYGAMDQEARTLHLDKFRKGKTKLLFVTDVAARGIDVPLLNNVVNFAFPAAPKLFVHRVGRAARQGRTGTAYSLIDPEEIPHMLDLYLFLGRQPQNIFHSGAGVATQRDQGDGQDIQGAKKSAPQGYNVSDLRPDLVHYGNFPQQVMDDEMESMREQLKRANLTSLQKVCENAMKQYRKTRPDPSGRAITRAKELDKGETHPLLKRFEARGMVSAAAQADRSVFLRAMSSFRPKETIFELLGGGGTDAKGDMEQVMGAVRKRARVHRLLTRNEGTPDQQPQPPTSIVPEAPGVVGNKSFASYGSDATEATEERHSGASSAKTDERSNGGGARCVNGGAELDDGVSPMDVANGEEARPADGGSGGVGTVGIVTGASNRKDKSGSGEPTGVGPASSTKRKLSRFERKKMKKRAKLGGASAGGNQGNSSGVNSRGDSGGRNELALLEEEANELDEAAGKSYGGRGSGDILIGKDGPGRFADKSYYIGYGTTEESSFVDAAMQPRSVEKSTEGLVAGRLEEAILDVNPDEAVNMAKKQRLLHWDSRKKKFVQTTVGELAEGKGSTKIRTESGVVVKTKNAAKGEIYAKWKRATNRKVGREGDEEEALMPSNFSGAAAGGRGRRGRWATAGSIEMDESAVTSGGKGPQKDKNGRLIRDELRDREQIRKAKTKDEDKILKNMPKAKRRAILKKRKEKMMDPRKQMVQKQMQTRGHMRSRMRVKV